MATKRSASLSIYVHILFSLQGLKVLKQYTRLLHLQGINKIKLNANLHMNSSTLKTHV